MASPTEPFSLPSDFPVRVIERPRGPATGGAGARPTPRSHRHAAGEITCIRSERTVYGVGGREFRLAAGDIMVAAPLQDHRWQELGVSRACGVSPGHLSGVFRRELHRSPGRILREIRVRRGLDLIRDGALPVAEAATACGFGSLSAFERATVRLYGYPPRDCVTRGLPRVPDAPTRPGAAD